MVNLLTDVDEGLERFDPMNELVHRAVAKALELGHGPQNAQIGLLIVNDEAIQQINRQFRAVDHPTDVLSFPLLEPGATPAAQDIDPETGEVMLGDIVVSLPMAERQAEEYGHSLEREVAFLCVHGTLHLLGHDHEDEGDRKRMRALEEEVLAALHLPRNA